MLDDVTRFPFHKWLGLKLFIGHAMSSVTSKHNRDSLLNLRNYTFVVEATRPSLRRSVEVERLRPIRLCSRHLQHVRIANV